MQELEREPAGENECDTAGELSFPWWTAEDSEGWG